MNPWKSLFTELLFNFIRSAFTEAIKLGRCLCKVVLPLQVMGVADVSTRYLSLSACSSSE